jgi:hypothetical protein
MFYVLILLPSYIRESTKIFVESYVNNSCCLVTISGPVILSAETIAPVPNPEQSGPAWRGLQKLFVA